MILGRHSRLVGVLKVLTVTVLVTYCIVFAAHGRLSGNLLENIASKLPLLPLSHRIDEAFTPELLDFWTQFEQALQNTRPSCTITDKEEKVKWDDQKFEVERLQKDPRPDYINISEDDVAASRTAHGDIVEYIHQRAEMLSFRPGTRGIATTAGGKYIPVLLVSLRLLRQTGSTLPVEVFLSQWSEYDYHTCEKVLPSLNARCLVLSDMWSTTPSFRAVHQYQFKVFALLYSSFEDVLFLDADAFPLHDPNILFDAEPYRTTGFVTWPDFWASTTHASFYNIASIDPAPPRDLRYASESGEMLMSKPKHAATLLLATYYNYYGPDCFYHLLSQGAGGEGDKETFLHAAMALNASFWDVRAKVLALGSHESGEWRGAGMIQHDPMEDYDLEMEGLAEEDHKEKLATLVDAVVAAKKEEEQKGREKEKAKWWKNLKLHTSLTSGKKKNPSDETQGTNQETNDVDNTKQQERRPRPFFIHNNNHKLDPQHILDSGYHMKKDDGTYWRLWNGKQWTVETFGFDLERKVWEAVIMTGCEINADTCERLKDYWRKVFGDDER